jgi:hypothetical protein
MNATAAKGEQRAVRLLFAVLVAWLVGQIGFNFWQAAENGYGSGFGDGNHRLTAEQRDGLRQSFLLRNDR